MVYLETLWINGLFGKPKVYLETLKPHTKKLIIQKRKRNDDTILQYGFIFNYINNMGVESSLCNL